LDPYKVLGVKPGDDPETIKKAYRELAKKYHPDKYRNTNQYEWAMEKMKEINAAYDMLTGKNQGSGQQGYGPGAGGFGGGFGGFGGGFHGGSSGYTGSAQGLYNTIRQLLSQRRTDEAEAMLLNIQERPAEWYYLMGVVYNQKNWHSQARQFFQTAVQMDPNNYEYNQAYAAYNNAAGGFTRRTYNMGGNDTMCQLCQCLMISSMCGGFGRFMPFFFCC